MTTGSAQAGGGGTLNGTQVYSTTLSVSDATGNTTPTTFTFPSYMVKTTGTITWTATIADANPDTDAASASTTVSR